MFHTVDLEHKTILVLSVEVEIAFSKIPSPHEIKFVILSELSSKNERKKISQNYQCTVVTLLLYLGQEVFFRVLVDFVSHSLSNIIKHTMTRYYKSKISGYNVEIPQKF